jgi:hypothetical protein
MMRLALPSWEQVGETRDTHSEPHPLVYMASMLPICSKDNRKKVERSI